MTQAQITEFRNICKRNHWKCTHQRLTIYAYMYENKSHPCIDDVWEAVKQKIPGITRETVFRILCDFAEHEVISRMDHLCIARFDSKSEPHGHFICTKCGSITDFPIADVFQLPDMLRQTLIRHMELRVSGVCEKCRRGETSEK